LREPGGCAACIAEYNRRCHQRIASLAKLKSYYAV
jgi:hypothetical protein